MAETRGKHARRAAVIDSYKKGMSIEEMEKKYRISSNTIKTYLRDEKVRIAEKGKVIQQSRLQKRNEAILEDMNSGMSTQEAAEKEGISQSTIQRVLRAYRTAEVSPEILYSEIGMTADRKKTIKRWADRQAGRTINTPDGQMIVTAVYPHIVECLKRVPKRYIKATYTHGEVYYMNRKEETTYAYEDDQRAVY